VGTKFAQLASVTKPGQTNPLVTRHPPVTAVYNAGGTVTFKTNTTTHWTVKAKKADGSTVSSGSNPQSGPITIPVSPAITTFEIDWDDSWPKTIKRSQFWQ
jgi:hypothetical protein